MLVYGLAASAVGILFILLPVVIHSGVSIVQQKSDQKINKKMFWEKYFLDIVLLGVSIYLLHNFNQEIDKIRARALLGAKMDPLIFLDSVLFIVAMGLVVLRLLHYLVQLVYHIGRKKVASGSVRIVLTDHAELPQAGLYLGIFDSDRGDGTVQCQCGAHDQPEL